MMMQPHSENLFTGREADQNLALFLKNKILDPEKRELVPFDDMGSNR